MTTFFLTTIEGVAVCKINKTVNLFLSYFKTLTVGLAPGIALRTQLTLSHISHANGYDIPFRSQS